MADDIIDTPSVVTRLNPSQLEEITKNAEWNVGPLKQGRNKGIPYEDGGGLAMNKVVDGNVVGDYIQYHPGSGHHGNIPYYKVSSPKNGEVKFYNQNGE